MTTKPATRKRRQPESKSSQRRMATASRDAAIIRQRTAGKSLQSIADNFGMTRSGVHRVIDRWLERTAADTALATEQHRLLLAQRYERLIDANWEYATAGSDKHAAIVLRATDALRTLYGLDVPVRREISGPMGGPIQFEIETPADYLRRRVEEMHERMVADPESNVHALPTGTG